MNQEKQPEALRLAHLFDHPIPPDWSDMVAAASELRRLHALAESQRAELVAEAARTAEEKLRADQMTEQHRMQCNIRQESEDVLDAAKDHIRDLEAQLSAIGAGGVESLRKNGTARGQAGFEAWWRDKYPSFAMHAPDVWEAAMHHAAHPSLECLQQSAELPDCRGRVMVDEDGECGISWRGGMPPENGTNIYTEQQVRALQAAPPAPASVAAPSNRIAEALRAFDTAMEACSDYPDTSGDIDGLVKAVRKARAALAAAPAQAVAVPWDNFPAYLIDHCEGDTITEEGLQRALAAMLADPQYAAPAQEHATQLAGEPVAYLDLGAGGYLDIGTDLSDEQLSKLPKGRHMLVIGGTHGVDGYAAAPGEMQKESDAAQLLKKYRKLCLEIGRGDSYHIARIDAAIAAARAQAHKDERA